MFDFGTVRFEFQEYTVQVIRKFERIKKKCEVFLEFFRQKSRKRHFNIHIEEEEQKKIDQS